MAKYQEYNQEQEYFVTINKDVNYPEGTFVRFLNDFIETHIELKPFAEKRINDHCGAPAKHAKMILKIIFYGFSQGIYSMRELVSKYLTNHLDFIYLSGYQTIHHSTLSRFMIYYREEIISIFSTIFYISNNMGFVTKKLVAIDGSKIKANASKKFTGNAKTFKKKRETYIKMLANLLERANRINDGENKKTISKCNARSEYEKIKRLKTNYEYTIKRIDTFLENCDEKEKSQINLIDPDSKLMEKDKKYFQGYNCQAAVNEHGLIITNEVTNKASDRSLTYDIVNKSIKNLEQSGRSESEIKRTSFILDKGYHNSEAIGNLMREDYNILIPFHKRRDAEESEKINSHHCMQIISEGKYKLKCPGGLLMSCNKATKDGHGWIYKFFAYKNECKNCKYYSKCSGLVKKEKKFAIKKEVFDNLKELKQLKRKMEKAKYRDIYNKRLGIVEPVFGTIKSNRKFTNFIVKGLDNVNCCWSIICSSFNMRRMFKLSMGF